MSYTKGPWRIEGFDIRCNQQPDDTGTFVCEMNSSISPETTQSNAHLIASAPDLLEACKAAYVSLIGDEHYQEFKTVIQTLYRAISLSEGREGK